jgi:hypothetical protein
MSGTTNAFDEVMQKIKTRVPPPRTDAQAKAAALDTAASSPELELAPVRQEPLPAPPVTSATHIEPARAESVSVRRWFKPPLAAPKPRTRKVCFEIDEDIAARFKKLCFNQEVEQRRVVEQLLRGYLAANEKVDGARGA